MINKRNIIIFIIIFFLISVFVSKSFLENDIGTIYIEGNKFPVKYAIDDKKSYRDLIKGIQAGERIKKSSLPEIWYILKIDKNKDLKEILITFDGQLWLKTQDELFQLNVDSTTQKHIERLLQNLELHNPYGELLDWDIANKEFPKFANAKIIDLETKKSFMVERRAGSDHADVQPLTAKDTKIMKEIYDGYWSWRRRAIIVDTGEKKIAASMNGMPHGAGAIRGNNFNGHFCIHFFGSTTHSNNIDMGHQVMIWKSAGRYLEYLKTLTEEDYIRALFATINEGDKNLFIQTIMFEGNEAQFLGELVNKISVCKIEEIKKEQELQYSVKVNILLKNNRNQYKGELFFTLVKTSFGWKASGKEVYEGIQKII